jgi:hypothetical protein
VHSVRRCSVALWNVFAGQALHVRRSVVLSTEINDPAPHEDCAVHSVRRCSVALWNVFAGQALHVRRSVVLSAEINDPAPHVDCALQVLPAR